MTDRKQHATDLLSFDLQFKGNGLVVAGMDEVGRGPLAGNVVTACVVMPEEPVLVWIDDSKKLSEIRREKVYEEILRHALYIGIGEVSPAEIDEINILQATRKAMRAAAAGIPADIFLIDAVTGLGLKGKADLTQIEAQVADDELSCLLCENHYQQAILELGKMMGKAPSLLPRGKEIKPLLNPLEEELSVVNLLMNNSSTKVTISSPRGGREGASHPAALSARMNVQSAELAVQQARASFFPSLFISAGVSTGYSRSYGLGYHPKPFGRQWHDNMGSSISTGISIPLWDHLSHVHHLRRSKRQLTLARIEQEETLRQLQIDYTKACLDVEACEKEIAMQTKKLAADSVAHAVLLRRYEEGLSSLLDLQTVARTLQQSRISLLQQRLLLILKRRTLKQYGYFS